LHQLRPWLLIKRRRRRCRTTWAGHWRCENEADLTGPQQAYVSDITYLESDPGFVYLTLITDAWSRYIVGHHVSPRLTTAGSLAALQQVLARRPATAGDFIHHSDRGVQFTDQRY